MGPLGPEPELTFNRKYIGASFILFSFMSYYFDLCEKVKP